MAGRSPPTGFYSYKPPIASRPLCSSSIPPPPPPPPPARPSQGTSPAFAYNYNYSSASAISSSRGVKSTNTSSGESPGKNKYHTTSIEVAMWTCDTCDIALKSERALKSHKKTHVKCVQCSFEGVPKAVKVHYQANHGKFSRSGFKTVTVAIPGCRVQRYRICVGNRPEDIQKWIADRKKRFPRQEKQKESMTSEIADKKPQTVSANAEDDAGLSSLLAGYGSSSESEDENAKKTKEKEETIQEMIPDAATPDPDTKDVNNINESMSRPKVTRLCRFFMKKGSCMNGDACRFSHDRNNVQQLPGGNTRKRKRGQSSSNDNLLRKLLSNDMERESSLATQLLGYIVDCSFFEGELLHQEEAKMAEK